MEFKLLFDLEGLKKVFIKENILYIVGIAFTFAFYLSFKFFPYNFLLNLVIFLMIFSIYFIFLFKFWKLFWIKKLKFQFGDENKLKISIREKKLIIIKNNIEKYYYWNEVEKIKYNKNYTFIKIKDLELIILNKEENFELMNQLKENILKVEPNQKLKYIFSKKNILLVFLTVAMAFFYITPIKVLVANQKYLFNKSYQGRTLECLNNYQGGLVSSGDDWLVNLNLKNGELIFKYVQNNFFKISWDGNIFDRYRAIEAKVYNGNELLCTVKGKGNENEKDKSITLNIEKSELEKIKSLEKTNLQIKFSIEYRAMNILEKEQYWGIISKAKFEELNTEYKKEQERGNNFFIFIEDNYFFLRILFNSFSGPNITTKGSENNNN